MNLLDDEIFSVELEASTERTSLPGVFEALANDHLVSFPGVQRHQEDAFHVFLCYLAGAILCRAQTEDPHQAFDYWRRGLLSLSDEKISAWTLVVDDLAEPAFMQPPLIGQTFPKPPTLTVKAQTPDQLDMLQTAKNHDVKQARSRDASPELWALALITAQTMSGFMGRGNFGISRMNSGAGSRAIVELKRRGSPGTRWTDAVKRLTKLRRSLLAGPWGYRNDGITLVWTVPWDLRSGISTKDLDPFFVEICRAYRLARSGDRIVARATSAHAARIAAKELKGKMGDPWTPINTDKDAALTMSGTGFDAKRIRDMIFEKGFRLQPMQKPLSTLDTDQYKFSASVLVGGQGKTDGFHRVSVPVPGRIARRLFSNAESRECIAKISQKALENTTKMQNRVLKGAVLMIYEAAPDTLDWKKNEAVDWWKEPRKHFSSLWEQKFFPWLWHAADAEGQIAETDWIHILRSAAETVLERELRKAPSHAGRRYRTRSLSKRFFFGSLYKNFPELKEASNER